MSRASELLSRAIEAFNSFKPTAEAHITAKNNPHEVTKSQVGLGNVDNAKQATKAQFDAHTGNTSNPHSVTKAQVGLGSVDNVKQATKTEFTAHTGNRANPHGVTKSQVGLGDVQNVRQVSENRYNNHVNGSVDKHTADDVMFTPTRTVKQKIDELIISGGGGTMHHDELDGRSLANAHPISAISGATEAYGKVLRYSGATSDATQTTIDVIGEDEWYNAVAHRFVLPALTSAYFELIVSGTTASTGVGAPTYLFVTRGLIRAFSNSAASVSKLENPEVFASSTMSDCSVSFGSDSTLKVTGLADTDITWSAQIIFKNIVTLEE